MAGPNILRSKIESSQDADLGIVCASRPRKFQLRSMNGVTALRQVGHILINTNSQAP